MFFFPIFILHVNLPSGNRSLVDLRLSSVRSSWRIIEACMFTFSLQLLQLVDVFSLNLPLVYLLATLCLHVYRG